MNRTTLRPFDSRDGPFDRHATLTLGVKLLHTFPCGSSPNRNASPLLRSRRKPLSVDRDMQSPARRGYCAGFPNPTPVGLLTSIRLCDLIPANYSCRYILNRWSRGSGYQPRFSDPTLSAQPTGAGHAFSERGGYYPRRSSDDTTAALLKGNDGHRSPRCSTELAWMVPSATKSMYSGFPEPRILGRAPMATELVRGSIISQEQCPCLP